MYSLASQTAFSSCKRRKSGLASETNYVYYQGSVTFIASELRSATVVKMKVNGQLEIFAIVNGQAAISF